VHRRKVRGRGFPHGLEHDLAESRLVAGSPMQGLEDGKPVLGIRLTNNRTFLFGPGGQSLG